MYIKYTLKIITFYIYILRVYTLKIILICIIMNLVMYLIMQKSKLKYKYLLLD